MIPCPLPVENLAPRIFLAADYVMSTCRCAKAYYLMFTTFASIFATKNPDILARRLSCIVSNVFLRHSISHCLRSSFVVLVCNYRSPTSIVHYCTSSALPVGFSYRHATTRQLQYQFASSTHPRKFCRVLKSLVFRFEQPSSCLRQMITLEPTLLFLSDPTCSQPRL